MQIQLAFKQALEFLDNKGLDKSWAKTANIKALAEKLPLTHIFIALGETVLELLSNLGRREAALLLLRLGQRPHRPGLAERLVREVSDLERPLQVSASHLFKQFGSRDGVVVVPARELYLALEQEGAVVRRGARGLRGLELRRALGLLRCSGLPLAPAPCRRLSPFGGGGWGACAA